VGIHLTAFINVRLEKHREKGKRGPADEFGASVLSWPEVSDCMALTGEMDYLLRVVVSDMDHFSRFVMEKLLRHPSVQDCKSSFVLNQVKATRALPL
jgi:Lrp/AsnC family leucine-responsive transcriptional regulator